MDKLIDYDKAKRFSNFGVPEKCPSCKNKWKSEPPPLTLIQEGLFGGKRMAQNYHKTCEFCGHTYMYYG